MKQSLLLKLEEVEKLEKSGKIFHPFSQHHNPHWEERLVNFLVSYPYLIGSNRYRIEVIPLNQRKRTIFTVPTSPFGKNGYIVKILKNILYLFSFNGLVYVHDLIFHNNCLTDLYPGSSVQMKTGVLEAA